jgi:hypothetical protein
MLLPQKFPTRSSSSVPPLWHRSYPWSNSAGCSKQVICLVKTAHAIWEMETTRWGLVESGAWVPGASFAAAASFKTNKKK